MSFKQQVMKKYTLKQGIFLQFVVFIIHIFKPSYKMKKYTLAFVACVFTGSFDAADKAANDFQAGSGTTFSETENEKGKTLTFTDANGNEATLVAGDAFQPVNDENGTFKGYVAVDAAVVKTWSEVEAAA